GLRMARAQECDGVFAPPQGSFVNVLPGYIADKSLEWFGAGFAQSQVCAGLRFVTEQQAEVAQPVQSGAQELPATDVEVGGGYVERVSPVVAQEVVEDVGHVVLLVVDDEWDGHKAASIRAIEIGGILSDFARE